MECRPRPGRWRRTVDEAVEAAEELGLPVMVKSQVKIGGRGKAGGVKFAKTMDDVRTHAGNILGLDIKGHITRQILITPASDIAAEYYVSFLLDRSNRTFLAMATFEGGMEIEQLAVERPDALAKIPVERADRGGRREGRRDRRRRQVPRRGPRPGDRHPAAPVGDVRRRGRHPGRGEPAGQGRRRQGRRAGRQGVAGRERRRSGTPTTPRWRTPRRRTRWRCRPRRRA